MTCSRPSCQAHGDGFPVRGGTGAGEGEGGAVNSSGGLWCYSLFCWALAQRRSNERICAPGLKRSGNGNEDTFLLTVTPLLPHPLIDRPCYISYWCCVWFKLIHPGQNTLHFNFMSNLLGHIGTTFSILISSTAPLKVRPITPATPLNSATPLTPATPLTSWTVGSG